MNLQRYARICEMLARRQPDLTVCMEQVHKPHNVSAVIRTADAVGVHEVHAIWPAAVCAPWPPPPPAATAGCRSKPTVPLAMPSPFKRPGHADPGHPSL
jgi:hypothetical protein